MLWLCCDKKDQGLRVMTTGEIIKERRKVLGMTRDEFSEQIGVSCEMVKKIEERDTLKREIDLLDNIQSVLGISYYELANN